MKRAFFLCLPLLAAACGSSDDNTLPTFVKGTIAKTSNLVWILRADLFDVTSGKAVLADSYELKGDAARIAPAGAHVFAQRVERAVAEHPAAAVDP